VHALNARNRGHRGPAADGVRLVERLEALEAVIAPPTGSAPGCSLPSMGPPPDDDQEVLRAAMRNAICMVDAAHAAGLGAYREDDVGWVVAPENPDPVVNAVRPTRQHAGLVDQIPDILSTYPDHVPVGWWLMSDDGHDELGDALGRSGFELAGAMPAVAGPIPESVPEPSSDLVLAPPAGDGDWEAVAAVQRAGFALPAATSATVVRSVQALGEAETGPPTIEVVLARRAGVPISVGFVSHQAGVAGLWSLTTLPSARGTGVGSAMIDHRLALARARGTDVAFMFSGGDAEPLYAARGFRRIGACEIHVLAPRA
jgi:GNAT superfamily N-acetyltransferase